LTRLGSRVGLTQDLRGFRVIRARAFQIHLQTLYPKRLGMLQLKKSPARRGRFFFIYQDFCSSVISSRFCEKSQWERARFLTTFEMTSKSPIYLTLNVRQGLRAQPLALHALTRQ